MEISENSIKDLEILGTEVLLPSKGLPYNGLIPDGKVRVLPMRTRDEKRIIGSAPSDALNNIDAVLDRCIPVKDFSADKYVTGDRFYLLNVLRAVSYGSDYTFNLNCSQCNQSGVYSIDLLNDLDVIFLPDNFKEPIVVELPGAKASVSLRLLRGSDEKDITKYTEKVYAKSNASLAGDPTYSYRMAKHIVAVESPRVNFDQNTINAQSQAIEFFDNMLASDARIIREALTNNDCGPDTELRLDCKRCRSSFTTAMPYQLEFFRPGSRRG
jgi:hypothetical protein